MQQNLLKVLGALALIAMLICFVFVALGMIGAVATGNGCFMRYDATGKSGSDSISSISTLNANANYTNTSTMLPDGTMQIIPNPDHYGEWLNTDISVQDKQEVALEINGKISLCLAYIPKNNVQFTESTRPSKSNLDDKGKLIPIPRITDVNKEPISLIMDAKNAEWRNIAELYNNDQILVSVSPNYIDGVTDAFKGTTVTADCSEGKTSYNPVCGRYSVYSGEYANDCEWKDNYWNCNYHNTECTCLLGCGKISCDIADFVGEGSCCPHPACDRCGAWLNIYGSMPEAYKNDGSSTIDWSDNKEEIFFDFSNLECSTNSKVSPSNTCPDKVIKRDPKDLDFIKGKCSGVWVGSRCLDSSAPGFIGTIEKAKLTNLKHFWYTADGNGGSGPTGLIWQISSNGVVNNDPVTKPEFARFAAVTDQPDEYKDKYKVIYNIPFTGNQKIGYLQYRLWSPSTQNATNNTGGYVINIKQTKCYRENGNSFSDVFNNRGQVEYVIVPHGENPNDSTSSLPSRSSLKVDTNGKAKIKADSEGYLWMRILNDPKDYKDSEGSYKVKFLTNQPVGSFTLKVMTPLLELFKTKVQGAAESIFKNMVCYGDDKANCANLFTYIKALLTLYVMSYGAMYLLGFIKINQRDLIIRIIKIGIVAGLMNGSTFEFFNNYLFNAITGFSDEIISNMSGYSLFTSTNTVSNPFMFLDAVMSKIFFSQTFIAQLLSLLSLGLSGIIYFIIVFIALGIVIITALRAIAVYIMAFMATCILIGIAPLFISFLLFDFTRYLFDNWVRFTLRYMLEPVILMAGIIVLTQLFTIYLDFVLGYSVCWKCALALKIPFIGTILPIALVDVPIFCINWFTPWGMDYMSGMMGINMQNIIALVIIAYGMYGYVEFSGHMVARLTNAAGPSATEIGGKMSDDAEQGTLKQVGLDEKTRSKITGEASGRLETRNNTLEEAEKNQKNAPTPETSRKPEMPK